MTVTMIRHLVVVVLALVLSIRSAAASTAGTLERRGYPTKEVIITITRPDKGKAIAEDNTEDPVANAIQDAVQNAVDGAGPSSRNFCPEGSDWGGRNCRAPGLGRVFADLCVARDEHMNIVWMGHLFGACPLNSVCVPDYIDPAGLSSTVKCVFFDEDYPEARRIRDHFGGIIPYPPESDTSLLALNVPIRVMDHMGPAGVSATLILCPRPLFGQERDPSQEVRWNDWGEKTYVTENDGYQSRSDSSEDEDSDILSQLSAGDNDCSLDRLWDQEYVLPDEDWEQTDIKWMPPPPIPQCRTQRIFGAIKDSVVRFLMLLPPCELIFLIIYSYQRERRQKLLGPP